MSSSEEEESAEEWEDVPQDTVDSLLSSQGDEVGGKGDGSLEIVVASGNLKDKGKGKLVSDAIRRAMMAAEKEAWLQAHQVNLLVLVARGIRLSRLCSDHTFQALTLSALATDAPGLILESPGNYTKSVLARLVRWMSLEGNRLQTNIAKELAKLRDEGDLDVSGGDWRDLMEVSKAMYLVSLLRVLGLRGRLVTVLGPLKPIKPPSSLFRTGSQERKGGKKTAKKMKKEEADNNDGRRDTEIVEKNRVTMIGEPVGMAKLSEEEGLGAQLLRFNIEQEQKAKERAKEMEEKEQEGKTGKKKRKRSSGRLEGEIHGGKGKGSKRGKRKSCPVGKGSTAKGSVGVSPGKSTSIELSDDEDFDPQSLKKKRQVKQAASPEKKKMKFSQDKKLARSPSVEVLDKDVGVAKGGSTSEDVELLDVQETGNWAEAYIPGIKKWVCLHLPSCSVDQPKLCEKHSLLPLHYVLAFEHHQSSTDHGYVTDVTARYASDWCTNTRKHRVNETWWAESLQPYRPDNLIEIMDENEDIAAGLSSKSLPLSISEYKNHPLYVLRRHLLKFEAIYPKDCEVLGHCKGEAVYSRKNVHTLHTRETWLKEGRMVRRDEEPYGVVKARPKRGQSSNDVMTSEVFGRWQTEEYMPPIVVEGKIPRNEYGNVDMYKTSMLPVGAVHLKDVGISKVARKLGVDCAPAVVGFDFHGGHSHPVIDGVIVPEESAELLLEAWETEQQIAIEKDRTKREKRVLGHWRRLTKAVLIRHRVQEQFDTINS